LAAALEFSGKPGDALSTLENLQRIPAPLGTDPRIDLRV
jgi:hypothetical protein